MQRIQRVEHEAWLAWERSKLAAVEETTRRRLAGQDDANVDDDGAQLVTERTEQQTIKGRDGDKKWLEVIQWCSEQRSKIFGLYAPPRTPEDGGAQPTEQELLAEAERLGIEPTRYRLPHLPDNVTGYGNGHKGNGHG